MAKRHIYKKTNIDGTTEDLGLTLSQEEVDKLASVESGAQVNKVNSVNGKTGTVTLSATDVSALPSNTTYVSSVNGGSGAITNVMTTNTAQTVSGEKSYTAHQYFQGGTASSSVSNTSQIVMTKPDGTQQFAITSNDNAFIVNPNTTSTTGQLVCDLGNKIYMTGADLGRSESNWKDLYLSGGIYNSSNNKLTLPSNAGTLALTSQIPTNYVTTDKAQTVTGVKTFTQPIIAPQFKSDDTSAGMYLGANNELAFGSNSNILYIGYVNRLNSSGAINTYYFGTHTGSSGQTSGNIYCGSTNITNSTTGKAWKTSQDSSGNLVFEYV